MDSIIGQLLTLGPGYIMAAVLFYILVKNNEIHREERKQAQAELTKLVERQQAVEEKAYDFRAKQIEALQGIHVFMAQQASVDRIEERLRGIADAQRKAG